MLLVKNSSLYWCNIFLLVYIYSVKTAIFKLFMPLYLQLQMLMRCQTDRNTHAYTLKCAHLAEFLFFCLKFTWFCFTQLLLFICFICVSQLPTHWPPRYASARAASCCTHFIANNSTMLHFQCYFFRLAQCCCCCCAFKCTLHMLYVCSYFFFFSQMCLLVCFCT